MKNRIKPLLAAAGAGLVLVATGCSGGVVQAQEAGEKVTLTVASMQPAGTPNYAPVGWILDEIEARTDQVEFNRTAPESLCPASEIVQCVIDGRADMGTAVTSYTPQLFPDDGLVGIPFRAQDSQAITAALHELATEDPQMMKVYEDNGLKQIINWTAGRMWVGTKQPVTKVEDLAGLSIRATGAGPQALIQATGANAVALPTPDVYESLERGVIQGAGYSMDGVVNYKFMEPLKHWTDLGSGHYATFAFWMNPAAYDGLPDDVKKVFDEVVAEANGGAALEAFNSLVDEQALCQQMKDAGVSLTALPQDEQEKLEATIGDGVLEAWKSSARESGVQDPDALYEKYTELITKYDNSGVADTGASCLDSYTNG